MYYYLKTYFLHIVSCLPWKNHLTSPSIYYPDQMTKISSTYVIGKFLGFYEILKDYVFSHWASENILLCLSNILIFYFYLFEAHSSTVVLSSRYYIFAFFISFFNTLNDFQYARWFFSTPFLICRTSLELIPLGGFRRAHYIGRLPLLLLISHSHYLLPLSYPLGWNHIL